MAKFDFGQVVLAAMENEQKLKDTAAQRAIDQRRFEAQVSLQQQEMAQKQQSYDLANKEFEYRKQEDALKNPMITGKGIGDFIKTAGFGDVAGDLTNSLGELKPDTIAASHNNPLNLKFAGQAGATQGDKAPDGGYYAKFQDVPTALGAYANQLQAGSYKNLSVNDALQKWSNKGYDASKLGLSDIKDKSVGSLSTDELSTMINKMAVGEGSVKQGTSLIPQGNVGESTAFPQGIQQDALLNLLKLRRENDQYKATQSRLADEDKARKDYWDMITSDKTERLLARKNSNDMSKELDAQNFNLTPPDKTSLPSFGSKVMNNIMEGLGTMGGSGIPYSSAMLGGDEDAQIQSDWKQFGNQAFKYADIVLKYRDKSIDNVGVGNIDDAINALQSYHFGIQNGVAPLKDKQMAIDYMRRLYNMKQGYGPSFNETVKKDLQDNAAQNKEKEAAFKATLH